MNLKHLRQGVSLVMLVVCLALGSRAAAQTPGGGWNSLDIGASSPGGTNSAYDGFSVYASGGDVWNQTDDFRFIYRQLTGDGVIIARIANFNTPEAWAKAGLMIRESLSGGSKYAYVFRTGSFGIGLQHRSNTYDWAAHDALTGSDAAFLKLERQGSRLTASYSHDSVNWAQLGQTSIAMNNSVYIGLAIASHSWQYASADFTHVYASDLPTWQSQDIGSVSYAGALAKTGDSMYLRGTGADIWNTADEFRFAYTALTGDGSIVARVANFTPTQTWSKTGVMIRESLNANSKHAFAAVTGGQGVAFQRRASTGGWSEHTAGGWGAAPVWLKVERRGSTLTASYSNDGSSWIPMGSDTISMGQTIYAGLAIVSGTSGYAAAEFSNVSVAAASGGGGGGGGSVAPSPSGWSSLDLGSPLLAGLTTAIEGGLALTAGGLDIWETSDQFRYTYQQMTGDGTIVALVRNLNAADTWTKAGVMIRESLSANSRHAFMFLTGGRTAAFQRRTATGGMTAYTGGPSTGAPVFLRLERRGSTITGSYSWDAINWATLGSDTVSMGSTVYVGFALTSHSLLLYSTAHFTNVSVTSGSGSTAPLGNQAPQVSLTTPTAGANFAAPAAISMTASASDADGAVSVVEFYWGPYLLGSDTTSPYTFTWYGIPSGTYSLTAVARDSSGAMTVSSERTISVGGATQGSYAVFAPSSNHSTAVSEYVLNIFPAGVSPDTWNALASVGLGLPGIVNGEIRVDIGWIVSGLPSGSYFATVTAVGPGGSATSGAAQFSR